MRWKEKKSNVRRTDKLSHLEDVTKQLNARRGCGSVGTVVASDSRGSNLVIGKNLYRTLTVNCIEKTKRKRGREWPILQNN